MSKEKNETGEIILAELRKRIEIAMQLAMDENKKDYLELNKRLDSMEAKKLEGKKKGKKTTKWIIECDDPDVTLEEG